MQRRCTGLTSLTIRRVETEIATSLSTLAEGDTFQHRLQGHSTREVGVSTDFALKR